MDGWECILTVYAGSTNSILKKTEEVFWYLNRSFTDRIKLGGKC